MLKDLGIACSLANLCYFSVWGQLLPGSPLHYFLEHPPPRATLLVAIAGVAMLTAIFFAGATLARRSGSALLRHVVRLAFLVMVVVALNGIRRQTPALALGGMVQMLGKIGLAVVAGGLGLAALVIFVKWWASAVRGVAMIVLVLLPFALLTLSQAAWAVVAWDRAFADFANGPYVPRLESQRGRVLWLLFDELDYRLAFEQRPAGLLLPELDRFRAQAVNATHAYPPAGETFLSVPALMTGIPVAEAKPSGPRQLRIRAVGAEDAIDLNGAPTVFSSWHEAGGNAAAVGFFHPYCRLFNQSLIDCAWSTDYSGQARKHVPGLSLKETAMVQTADVLDGFPLASRLGVRKALINRAGGARAKRRALGVERFERILAESKRIVSAGQADLVYLHFPVPHSPYVYDRVKGVLVDDQSRSYADNLALTDRSLGELRRLMETAGSWDSTTVLITSDHWYRVNLWKPWKSQGEDAKLGREGDFKVPMLLKLAGQQETVEYETPFTTTILSSLVLALGGEVKTPADAVRWLTQHASYLPPVCGRNSACKGQRPGGPPAGG